MGMHTILFSILVAAVWGCVTKLAGTPVSYYYYYTELAKRFVVYNIACISVCTITPRIRICVAFNARSKAQSCRLMRLPFFSLKTPNFCFCFFLLFFPIFRTGHAVLA